MHALCAKQYDRFADLFAGGNVPYKLFKFCKDNLPYNVESGDEQTTQTPAGIVTMASIRGVDCKHYSLFIAGVLESLNRLGLGDYDGAFRFARYNGKKREDHVFVVLYNPDGSETWIDPTPIWNKDKKAWISRSFNDRLIVPVSYTDKIFSMALYRMSGLDQKGASVGTFYTIPEPAGNSKCNGVGATSVQPYTTSTTSTTSTTQTQTGDGTQLQVDPALQQAAAADPQVAAVLGVADKILKTLPEGGLKYFVRDFLKDPGGAVRSLIFGKPYTSNSYRLGEYYMRAILGMPEIQNRGQVPDGIVPQASDFFSSALGVRISSADHLDALAKSPQDYVTWMKGIISDIPMANIERAHRILRKFDYPQNQIDGRRNTPWKLTTFADEPYLLPIFGSEPNMKFSGTHPILNMSFNNGYPVQQPGTGDSNQTGTSRPPAKQAGIGGLGLFLLVGAGVGLLYAANKKKKPSTATR